MPSETMTSHRTKRPELLSPVGDWDCLQAALQNGADAVYLGVKDFNARLYTRNFTVEELDDVSISTLKRGQSLFNVEHSG